MSNHLFIGKFDTDRYSKAERPIIDALKKDDPNALQSVLTSQYKDINLRMPLHYCMDADCLNVKKETFSDEVSLLHIAAYLGAQKIAAWLLNQGMPADTPLTIIKQNKEQ